MSSFSICFEGCPNNESPTRMKVRSSLSMVAGGVPRQNMSQSPDVPLPSEGRQFDSLRRRARLLGESPYLAKEKETTPEKEGSQGFPVVGPRISDLCGEACVKIGLIFCE